MFIDDRHTSVLRDNNKNNKKNILKRRENFKKRY